VPAIVQAEQLDRIGIYECLLVPAFSVRTASNQTIFELRQQQSMAGVVTEAGYDAWAINLRGKDALACSWYG
jgi:BarA-like signal transduction histidine kinase